MEARLIGLKRDGEWMECELDVTISFEQEMLPVSGEETYWNDYIGGYKGWSIDYSGKFTTGSSLGHSNKIIERFTNEQDSEYELYFGARDGVSQEFFLKGKARLQNGSINAPSTGSAMTNFSFIGCGRLESWWREFWQIINAMPYDADKPLIIDTSRW